MIKSRKPLGDVVIKNLYQIIEKNPFKEAIRLDTEKTSLNECLEIIKKNFN